MSALDFFSGAGRHSIVNAIHHIMLEGERSGEAVLTAKDGREIPYLLNGIRITINQKPCFLGTGIDLSDRKRQQKALQESELRYRTLFNESRDGIFITLPEGMLVEANPSFLDIFGYTRDEMIGMDVTEIYTSPLDRDKFREEIARTGSLKGYPISLKRKDGSLMQCRVTASLRRAGDGTIIGYQGILREVTAEMEAEKRIREQNSFLNSLLESVTHPFYVVDAHDYRILLANSAARGAFFAGPTTCHGATHGSMQPCDTVQYPCPVQEVKRTGKPVTLEHAHSDASGMERNVEIHAYPVIDDEGKVSKAIEYTVDITERKRTEHALKQSEERMRLVIEASPIGIGIVQDEKYVYVNPALAETFGYESAQAIVGLRSEDLFVEPDRASVATYARRLRQGESVSPPAVELMGLRKNGEQFQASVWLTAIDFQEKPALLGFVADISKEKALRSQLVQAQKMEAVGTLAGGIAHDFNNLLTIIQGFSELLLLEKKEDASDYADLLKIIHAARNGADLVRRILTFSRKVEPKLRPIDLNHEVAQAEGLLRRTIPKMTEIDLVLDKTLGKINADPSQIEQILLNLAVNAQHAMPEGGKLVIETKNVILDECYCRTHIDVRPGRYALLTVTDNGCGMEPDVLEHVFEPFFTTKKSGEGTGLGLAMVFGIVKSHNGVITCHSAPRVGTAFDMYFPVIEIPDKTDAVVTDLSLAVGNETILLVDDEEAIRELGKKILSRSGYRVITASTGTEAVEIYRSGQEHIALIVLDVIMPVMSGKQCLEKLLQINPKAKVLITSGFSVDGPTKEALELGSKGFVGKPFKMSEVLATVRKILDEDDGRIPGTVSS
jgi:two-component system, cell cycle sensor histidine kinase and response regulator CckA